MSDNKLGWGANRREVLRLMAGLGGLAAGFSWLPPPFARGASHAEGTNSRGQGGENAPTMPWYGRELIRGHISWLHPAWSRPERDFDARRWIDQFERAGFRSFVFYSKFHDGVCNWPSKFQELKPERDFVGEITTEAHRRKMRVIIYYSAGPDDWAADRHPDWRCVRRDGSVVGKRINPKAPEGHIRRFKFAFCCPNSPYRAYALSQIDEILTNYDVDGFWIDVMAFPGIDRAEPERGHQGCFCRYCREKYALRTGGGSLFDIDGTPEQYKWEADSLRDFFTAAKEIVRKKGNDRSITYNGCGHLTPPYFWPDLQNLGDYLSIEGFQYVQAQVGATCRLARSAGKPFEIICVASGQTIGWTPKNTDLLLLEAAAVTAHGGTYCCAMDPTASGKIFDNQIEQVAAVSSYLAKRQDWLHPTSPVYDVAVFHPSYLAPEPVETGVPPLTRASKGWPDLLAQRNIPYAYLYPDSELSPFKVAILDRSFPISDQLVEKVKAYVKQGGSILAELNPAQLSSPAGQELLSEVLGVRWQGPTEYEAVYLGKLDPSIASGMTEMPTLVEGPSYRIEPSTAQPLAYYTYPIAPWSLSRMTFAFHNPPSNQASNDPAITLNRCGSGLAMFVACSLGGTEIRRHQNLISDASPAGLLQQHEWALRFGENLVMCLVDEPLLRYEGPAGVEIVVNRQPGRHIVHLLNNLLSPVLFADDRPGRLVLADVSFAINEKRIGPVRQVVMIDGTGLPMKRDGKWLWVTVPRLKVHEVLAWIH